MPRVGSDRRRPGRPLLGSEPRDQRVSAVVPRWVKNAVIASGGSESDLICRLLEAHFEHLRPAPVPRATSTRPRGPASSRFRSSTALGHEDQDE